MGEIKPLPGTSPTYDKIEGVIEEIIFGVVFDLVFAKMLTAVPWVGLPVVKQVVQFVLRKILQVIYNELEQEIALLVIDARVKAEVASYEAAIVALRDEMAQIGMDNAEQLEKAKAEFRERLRALIQYPH